MYKQSETSLYTPFLTKILTPSFDIVINYSEQLDETCVEFPHKHNDYEIYYSIEGMLHLQVQKKSISVPAGHFVFIPPNIEHGSLYEPHNPKKYFVVVFNFKEHLQASKKQMHLESSRHILETLMQEIDNETFHFAKDVHHGSEYLQSISQELINRSFGWELMLKNHYSSLLIGLFRSLVSNDLEIRHKNPELNTAIQITKFMHSHYSENITLQDVSDSLNICPRHINRLFKEYFGTSFAKTLSIYRLSYAKNYLYDTDISIEEIAHKVGFSSPQALYRLFKERENMTVKEYKKMIIEKKNK